MEKDQKDSMQNNGIIQNNKNTNNQKNTIIYCPILLCDKEIDLDKVKVILEELKKIIQGESGNGLQAQGRNI